MLQSLQQSFSTNIHAIDMIFVTRDADELLPMLVDDQQDHFMCMEWCPIRVSHSHLLGVLHSYLGS